jgi:hypothetical protein
VNAGVGNQVTVHRAQVAAELLCTAHPQQHHGLLAVPHACNRVLCFLQLLHPIQHHTAGELPRFQRHSKQDQSFILHAHRLRELADLCPTRSVRGARVKLQT